MLQSCSFCGKSFNRSDRALRSEKFCSNCITQRLKESGATFFDKSKITLNYNKSGYLTVTPNN